MSVNNVISEDQYPAWMKQAKRGVDWGALLIIGFCLIAAWSFITQDDLSATNDSEAYVFRTADYVDAFEQGIFYSRWSPHSVYGYGSPIPNYYPSGATYFSGLIAYLFTNNPITAVRVVYVLSFVLAGSMMYTFVTQRTTAVAGMMAAILYVFSPYLMITVTHVEGDLPLAIGAALLPTLLWAVNRLLQRHLPIDFTIIAVTVATIIFTVPIILLQGIIAILVLLAIQYHEKRDWGRIRILVVAMLTGTLLSAFYWLPAIIQYNGITWYPALYDPVPAQLSLMELVMPPQAIDGSLTLPLPSYQLGWGILFALIISLITLFLSNTQRLFSVAYLATGLLVLILVLLITPANTSWLVLVIFCFSVAGSHIGQNIYRELRFGRLFSGLVMLFAIASVMTIWRIPSPDLKVESFSGEAQVAYEQARYGYAGLPYGLPLPSHLSPDYAYNEPVAERYSETIARLFDSRTISSTISESPYGGIYNITSDTATSIRYNRAYFPGWQGYSNSGIFSITPSNDGISSLNIPANTVDETVTVRLGLNRLTLSAWLLSGVALLMCLLVPGYRFQRATVNYDSSILLPRNGRYFLTFLLISLIIVRATSPDMASDILARILPPEIDPPLSVRTRFEDSFELTSYQFSRPSYAIGQDIELQIYWSLARQTNVNYMVRLRLTHGRENATVYTSPYTYAGHFPTARWETSNSFLQEFVIHFDESVASGDYFVEFDIIACQEICELDTISLREPDGKIRITRPLVID